MFQAAMQLPDPIMIVLANAKAVVTGCCKNHMGMLLTATVK